MTNEQIIIHALENTVKTLRMRETNQKRIISEEAEKLSKCKETCAAIRDEVTEQYQQEIDRLTTERHEQAELIRSMRQRDQERDLDSKCAGKEAVNDLVLAQAQIDLLGTIIINAMKGPKL